MSTKTLRKRIALVAVSALGFGLFSAAPSSAAVTAITDMTVATVAAGPTNKNLTVTAIDTTAGARTYAIYTGGASTVATADIQLVNKLTGLSADTQKNWVAPGALTLSSAAQTKFATFPATALGADKTDANGAAVTGSLTLTDTPTGITTSTLAASQTGTTYTIFGQRSADTAGTPAANQVYAQVKVYSTTLEATLGDGGAPTTNNAVSGIAGPANTVSVRVFENSNDTTFNLRRLVTVTGADATISTPSAGSIAVATGGKSAVITPADATANWVTLSVLTPTAGTVTISAFTETAAGSGIFSATAGSTVTATINATGVSNVLSYSEAFVTTTTGAAATATTDLAARTTTPSVVSTASTTPLVRLDVTQYDALDVALQSTATKAVVVEITGAGALGTANNARLGSYIAVAAASANAQTFYVFPDGRSGTGTISVKVNGVEVISRTVTFFGSASTYTAVVNKKHVASTGVATADVVSVTVKDANGNPVSGVTVFASVGTATEASVEASDVTSATGVAKFDVTGALSKFGAVTITFRNASTAAAATVTTTAVVGVSSARAAAITVTTDKETYTPGEKITLTFTAKDSNGLGLPDGSYAAGDLLANSAANPVASSNSGTTPFLGTAAVVLEAGIATAVTYAPLASGPINWSWTIAGTAGGASTTNLAAALLGTKVTAAATVSESSAETAASAAADAAAEATDAANAATDAANAAAEAADAATAAAQDAADAVAALSTQVSEMVNALKKQITALTNLVIKIQKKVRA